MQNKIECCMTDELQDVLAAVTRIDTDLNSLLNVIGLMQDHCDNSVPNEAHGYINLIKICLETIHENMNCVVNLIDIV